MSHVISILDPETETPAELAPLTQARHLELRFHDVIDEAESVESPAPSHIEHLLRFTWELHEEGRNTAHLLIHCHAGFSRSPAAAILVLAQERPESPADDIVREIRNARPHIWPNLSMLEIGDRLLDRRGEITEAAHKLYRSQLRDNPELAQLMTKYGRAREVAAGGALSGPLTNHP
ncbi:MAG: dual specificity protein phosphatase family protein [Acetobacteraceae bacterium]|nr:dual specificity protein phosphatase family protein [Acetobacteraceae bacterium]